MANRLLASAGVLALMIVGISLVGQAATAQAPAPGTGRSAGTDRWTTPRTSWGDPDLQGIYTSNEMYGVPLERPAEGARSALTEEEARVRYSKRVTDNVNAEVTGNIGAEWRDTTYRKQEPSTQVSVVVDPPDGTIPPLTPEAEQRAAARAEARRGRGPADSWEDRDTWGRCITRGLPGLMIPFSYNNNLQIVQGPGYVAITHEVIHETRLIPTTPQPAVGNDLRLWLGVPRGRWEGDTLVVETTNFNGKSEYHGSGLDLHLTEWFTRTGPEKMEYRFTVGDPTTWKRPWSGRLTLSRDDAQYEIVEYACHEGNYGMINILEGARAQEKAAEEAAKKK